jgi:hypothetical protein
MARVTMTYAQVRKCALLLNMRYTAGEIAEAIGCAPVTVRASYIPAGAPVDVDATGQVWLIGSAFREWAQALYAGRKGERRPMHSDQAFCLRCRRPVVPKNPEHRTSGRVVTLSGSCPVCGGGVVRLFSLSAGSGGEP